MPTSESTRPSLLVKLKADDSRAWFEFVDLYGPLVGHWCRAKGLPPEPAADCVQEVFAAVARSIETFTPNRLHGSFRAWLWTIAINKIRDAARREAAGRNAGHPEAIGGSTAALRLQNAADPAGSDAGVPDDDAKNLDDSEPEDDSPRQALAHRAMRQIRFEFSSRTWRMFERSVIDGQATAVVADEMGVTPAAVRQARSRVLQRIRQQLGDRR